MKVVEFHNLIGAFLRKAGYRYEGNYSNLGVPVRNSRIMREQNNNINPVIRFISKPYRYAAVFSLLLTAVFIFTLLDAFVIPKAMKTVSLSSNPQLPLTSEQPPTVDRVTEQPLIQNNNDAGNNRQEIIEEKTQNTPVVTAASYTDNNIEITIETLRVNDTDVYIADVKVSDIAYFRTAFANNIYGRNINEKTSVIAEEQNAILAINGDFYGFRDDGWVLRNGILYRSDGKDAALLMDMEGNFSCESVSASIDRQISGLWQIWSFGPPLVVDSLISVTKNQEISGRSANSNPRTAIGQIGELHYLFIVSDGRTRASAGLSLYELAALFKERGCSVAYNLDGGGSSAMYFNGQVVNNPTTGGRRIGEREVSDIVYVGY